MKARLGLLIALAAGVLALARDARAEEAHGLGRFLTGAYVAPQTKVSSLAGDGVLFLGGEGGVILAHSLVLGGAVYGTVTNVTSPRSLQSEAGNAHLGMAYGGVRMAASLLDQRRLHSTLGVLVGGGQAWSRSPDASFNRHDGFLVIEPHLEAEANVSRYLRIALGGGYRLVGNGDEQGFPSRRLAGPMAMFSVRFGEL